MLYVGREKLNRLKGEKKMETYEKLTNLEKIELLRKSGFGQYYNMEAEIESGKITSPCADCLDFFSAGISATELPYHAKCIGKLMGSGK